jgi:hypothetical protein
MPRGLGYFAVGLLLPVSLWAEQPLAADTPAALGFQQFYKCPDGPDVDRIGDTKTAGACLAACEARKNAAGCWWLDGTGRFPRQCRVCRTREPVKNRFRNDWALPMSSPSA